MERRFDARPAAARTEHDEAELIGRVATGDRRAFETLYRAYHPRLARFLQRMTRSTPLIEEIVNDTLLVVWRKAATFNGSSKVSTWIFAIAYRRACKSLQALDEPVDAGIDEREGLEADREEGRIVCTLMEEIAVQHGVPMDQCQGRAPARRGLTAAFRVRR